MKKALTLLLAALLLLALAACGGGDGAAADPNCGLYDATTLEMLGITMDVAEVFPEGFSIELQDGGKAKFNYDGKSYNLKWTLDGETFHAEGGGAELDGTLAGGVMQLNDVMGSGLNITLQQAVADGAAAAPAAGDGAEAAAGDYSWWNGKWYGWRVIYSASGDYAEAEGKAFDVVAQIEVNGDQGTLLLWDYDESEDDPVIDAQVSFGPGVTDKGTMIAESGEHFYSALNHADFLVDPGASVVSMIDNMICIEGTVEEDSDNWFTYNIYLRPWGTDWSDLNGVENDEFPYVDMMPMAYDWYQSQL